MHFKLTVAGQQQSRIHAVIYQHGGVYTVCARAKIRGKAFDESFTKRTTKLNYNRSPPHRIEISLQLYIYIYSDQSYRILLTIKVLDCLLYKKKKKTISTRFISVKLYELYIMGICILNKSPRDKNINSKEKSYCIGEY